MTIFDTQQRFGLISRLLHWLMAFALFWQFISALCHLLLAKDNAIREFFWSTHFTLGFILFLAVILRGIWGLMNIHRRPPLAKNLLGLAGHVGQGLLYLLMFAVPFIALIRAYGSGKGFNVFGLQIFPTTGLQEQGLMALGNSFHGPLGWVLLLLIIGHIFMVFVHHHFLKDDIAQRMI